jgi:hypothetical protein
MSTTSISRRTIAKGTAWTIPVIAFTAAAPQASASPVIGDLQLSYALMLTTDTHDPNSPSTSWCTAPELILTNTSTNGQTITILRIAAWNDYLQQYTFSTAIIGYPLAPGAVLPVGGNGAGTLDPGQAYYGLIQWQDASGTVHITATCPIYSQHLPCGYPGGAVAGTDTATCSPPAGVPLPAGW